MKRATLIAYAVPALPLAALYFPVYVFLAEFYATERGLTLGAIGLVFIAIRIFDAISDPLVGIASDQMTTRWGRRRIWLLLGAPIVVVSAWCVFVPPASAGLIWLVVFLFLLTLGWTIMLTPYFAWGAEMSGDYSERGRITIWRDAIGLLGTILAAVLYSLGGEGAGGLLWVALMIVVTLPIAVGWCVSAVPEPKDFSRSKQDATSMIQALRGEPLFLRLLAAFFFNGAANALPATLFLFFVEYRLGAEGRGGLLLVLYFGAAVLAAPLWIYGLRYFSKHRLWCIAMIYAGLVFLIAVTLREGDIAVFVAICILSGAALGADLGLPTAMQADLADLDTARSGAQRTGTLFALWSLTSKMALALSGGIALIMLELGGFATEGVNSEFALSTLTYLYALAPVILKAIAVALMWNFPLDAERQRALRREIEA